MSNKPHPAAALAAFLQYRNKTALPANAAYDATKVFYLTRGIDRTTNAFKNAVCRWDIRLQDEYGVSLEQAADGDSF